MIKIKKLLKNNIFIAIFFSVLFFNIGAKATAGYSSDEIYYGTTGTSVTAELNNLQKIKTDLTSLKSQGNASGANILSGKSAVVGGSLVNGSMTDKSGSTTAASTIVKNGTNADISIPANGYYNTSSKISVPITKIQQQIPAMTYLGTGTSGATFNVSSNPNYKNFTADNFIVGVQSVPGGDGNWSFGTDYSWPALYAKLSGMSGLSKSYNASTGVLTVTGGSITAYAVISKDQDKNSIYKQTTYTVNATFFAYLIEK